MVLFTILLIMLAIISIITILAISAGGALFVILFGDVIICAVLIVGIMIRLIKKKGSK